MAWAPTYATAADLKAFVRIDDTLDDTQVDLAVEAASRAVDEHCGRQFGLVDAPEARRYTPLPVRSRRRRTAWVVPIDDLMTEDGLEVATEAGVITSYRLRPANGPATGAPWTELLIEGVYLHGDDDEVEVTATWGWSQVPTAVKQATLLQASRLLSRRNSPYGVAGSPELGSELRLLAKVDPDVAVTLGPYVRRWAVA